MSVEDFVRLVNKDKRLKEKQKELNEIAVEG
jgi:hypothetical protein